MLSKKYQQSFHNGLLGLILFALVGCKSEEPVNHDLLIINGLIIDGTGVAAYEGDVAIDGDLIAAVGDLRDSHMGKTVIDAKGQVIAPGFIDVHTHLDPILGMPDAESHVRQGVTLALGGPDGSCPWPLKDHFDSLESLDLGMNIAYLTGHNTIRREVMGLENRAPTANELDEMKSLVESSMKSGAFGISTGLKYLPGAFSNVNEVIALSAVASEYDGFYTSHLREEGLGLIEAVQEAIQISRDAEIPVVLTHHKAIGMPMWGKSQQTLAMVDSAREIGLDIMMDQYPYIASYTGISVLIPAWARAGGQDAFLDRINDTVLRDSIKAGIVYNILNDRGGGDLNRILLARVRWDEGLEGKTLGEWAETLNLEPTAENGAELVIQAQQNGGASCVYFAMDHQDVDRIMQHPMTMIASDGRLSRLGVGHPHPRWYGTFPRVLGHYVRERKILPLNTAIHKMTGLPAARMGLTDRGIIKEDSYADVVIFNPKTVIDKATFDEPHQYPEGINYVIINGVVTVVDGEFTKNRAGRVIYGPGKE